MMDNLEPLITDGGRIVKMEVDYSSTCDEKITIAESLAANGKLQEALDTLLMLEKQTRTVSYRLCDLPKHNIFFHFLTSLSFLYSSHRTCNSFHSSIFIFMKPPNSLNLSLYLNHQNLFHPIF